MRKTKIKEKESIMQFAGILTKKQGKKILKALMKERKIKSRRLK